MGLEHKTILLKAMLLMLREKRMTLESFHRLPHFHLSLIHTAESMAALKDFYYNLGDRKSLENMDFMMLSLNIMTGILSDIWQLIRVLLLL